MTNKSQAINQPEDAPIDEPAEDNFFNSPTRGSSFGRTLLLFALLVLAGVVIARTVFFVDEAEYVYVTQFGQPVQLYVQPGLGLKWPYQSVWRFDRRLQMYEPPAREMLTEDKENLNIGWYVCWRIGGGALGGDAPATQQQIEPLVQQYLQSVGSAAVAESRLEERIQAAIAAEIGRTRLSQLVSLDPQNVQLDQIINRVSQAIRPMALEQFGIDVVDIRVKRFNYPESVKPAVFAEIRSERERVAVQYRAEGASERTRIESLATLQRDQLLARAKRDATRIRGEGEAKAIDIFNAAHSKDPEFYELLKTLETYRSLLDDQTTIVLSADSPLLKLLTRGLPSLTNPAGVSPSRETISNTPSPPETAALQGASTPAGESAP